MSISNDETITLLGHSSEIEIFLILKFFEAGIKGIINDLFSCLHSTLLMIR
jgi:hypothetical protein